MSKWKLFSKSKQKEEEPQPEENTATELEETTKEEQETGEKPLAEYRETLQTGSKTKKTSKPISNQIVWRDVNTIEKNIDNLHITRAQKPVTQLDKTVDRLLEKRKKK